MELLNSDCVLTDNLKPIITLAAIAAVILILLLLYLYVYPSQQTTTTTALPANFSSFSPISNRSFMAIQNGNISATYNISADYPSVYGRLSNQNLVFFNKSGNNTRTGWKTLTMQYPYPAAPFFEFFYVDGKNYVCSESASGNSNFTCIQNNISMPPIFVVLQNYTFETASNATNTALGLVSQLKFADNATYYNTTYMGYGASYFHDNIYYPNSADIKGTITIYTSTKYGIPLLYLITLNDPVYNATNNTVVLSMTLESLSRNVTMTGVVPPYLSRFMASNP